jgi:RNA ligase (TIGR02306 family)
MENQNSVAYVSLIGEVRAIEGADNIEQVIVGGWNAITQKGEYRVGDKVVVATTDAVIPQDLSDLMGVTNYLRKGQRVRTVKLRGVYSECLLIPFKYLAPKSLENNVNEGDDMMGILGITKYEPPVKTIQLSVGGRKVKRNENPNFHVYYKFPNQKNVPDMFTEEDEVVITRKLHGTNARYAILKKQKITFIEKIKIFLNSNFGIGGVKWKWCEYEFHIGSHNVLKNIQSL